MPTTEAPVVNVNFMPLNHLGGRIPLGTSFQAGGTSFFVPESDLSTLFEDWNLVRPTEMGLVPRVVEMLFQRYQSGVDRRLADGIEPLVADAEAKSELREQVLGGRVLTSFVGTAPLAAEMKAFIASCLGVHRPRRLRSHRGRHGHHGRHHQTPAGDRLQTRRRSRAGVFRDRQALSARRIVGEVRRARQPGYYKRPEVTAGVFDEDGYYRTGDVMAEIAPNQVAYVDRRNNVLKLAQGEFVAVAHLEAVFAGAALVRQVFVYGNSERPYLLAVIVPTVDALQKFAGDDAGLKAALSESLRETARTAELQSYELPVDFLVESEPFSTDNGLLSGVGKVLRPKLKEHYGERLEQLYADLAANRVDELRALRAAAADQPVLDTLIGAARALLGTGGAPEPEAHFTDLGGDSLSALTFSNLLQEIFGAEVPVGVIINPAGNLRQLAGYIEAERGADVKRPTFTTVHGAGATQIRAAELTFG